MKIALLSEGFPVCSTKPQVDKWASEYEDKGAGQLGLHELVVRADNVSMRKRRKSRLGRCLQPMHSVS